jgi:hypothetical protein
VQLLRKNENQARSALEKKYKGMHLREAFVTEENESEYEDMVVIGVVRSKIGHRGALEWHVQTNLLVEKVLDDGTTAMEQAPIPPPPGSATGGRAVVDNRGVYRINNELHALIMASKLNEGYHFRTSPTD